MLEVKEIPMSGQFSVVFDTGEDVFSSTYKHEDGDLYFLNVNRELSEFEWVQIDFDEAMDSLIEQLEIKHSYNDMEERYWFYDGEERYWFYDGE